MKNTPKQSKIPTASQAKGMTEASLEMANKNNAIIWESEIEPYIAKQIEKATENSKYSHTMKLRSAGLERWVLLADFIVTKLRELGYSVSCRTERSPNGACDITFSWGGASIAAITAREEIDSDVHRPWKVTPMAPERIKDPTDPARPWAHRGPIVRFGDNNNNEPSGT